MNDDNPITTEDHADIEYIKPKFACVYKMGKDYNYVDVLRLKHNIEKFTSVPFEFICLTDDMALLPTTFTAVNQGGDPDGIAVVDRPDYWAKPLMNACPGWWSVPELFRLHGPIVVTGLDTVFVDSVDPLFELALKCQDEFYMIHAFKKSEIFASGFMIWNGDWSWIYKEFSYKRHARYYRWEQRYTKAKLKERDVKIRGVQDHVDGIYSYKHHVRGKGLPEDARAILFHGTPRPSRVNRREEKWLHQAWS